MTYTGMRVKSPIIPKERWLIIKYFKLMNTHKLRKLNDRTGLFHLA